MVKEDFIIKEYISIKENGKQVIQAEMDRKHIYKIINKKINQKNESNTKVTLNPELNKALDNILGKEVKVNTLGNFKKD
jgi:hypothetical protein